MRLLYCDESNLEERDGDFLVYGGLVIDGANALSLSESVDEIRLRAGVRRDYRLKFNPSPDNLSHQDFLELKRNVVGAAIEHGVKFIVYLILHDISNDPDEARRNGINSICLNFNSILGREREAGVVLIDRFNDRGNLIEAHLSEKFSVGITGLPYARELRLDNIVGFHYSAIGQSNFPSLVDIVLGSFRYAINVHTRGNQQANQTARVLLELIQPLFFRNAEGEPVPELGLTFSPKAIRVARYREQYQSLKEFLAEAGIETAQRITDQRPY